jgi:hypothetical protein
VTTSFVDFFGRPDDDAPDGQQWSSPSWFGAPDGELGVCVPVGAVIGRSGTGVIAISHATAYSTGISFELVAQARGLKRSETQRVFHEQHLSPTDGAELSNAFLRVGSSSPMGRACRTSADVIRGTTRSGRRRARS